MWLYPMLAISLGDRGGPFLGSGPLMPDMGRSAITVTAITVNYGDSALEAGLKP
jgi:hypothetical protein